MRKATTRFLIIWSLLRQTSATILYSSSTLCSAILPTISRHRFQSLETVSQLHLALTDSYIKYALTALPEVPQSFLAGARARAALIYEQVNLTAAREFQRRRDSGAYPQCIGFGRRPSRTPKRRVRRITIDAPES